jgi:hypothetical protein
MNKNVFLFLTFTLLVLTFAVTSGCGKYMAQYSAPVILERYPVLGVGGVGSGETLWVKFSKSMDTSGFSLAEIGSKIKFPIDMTATATFYPDITPEMTWSDDDTKLTMANFFFIANPGNRVHMQASKEAIQDTNGQYLTENADLFNYTLAGLYVTERYPTIDAIITNIPITIVATFDNSVVTSEFLAGMGPDHTAGSPIPALPSVTWSNSDKTVSIENISWEASPGNVVEITYEAMDIYGNIVTNGQLLKYKLQ